VIVAESARQASNTGVDGASFQAVRKRARGIEVRYPVVALQRLRLQIPAQSQVQCQAARDLPVILHIPAEVLCALRFAEMRGHRSVGHLSQEEAGIRGAGAGGAEGISGQASTEVKRSRGRGGLIVVSAQQPEIDTGLQRMCAIDFGDLIEELPVQAAS